MNPLKSALAACAALALAAAPARATSWHNLGPRAMGMGGAQVALAQGPLASYWNPAGLGQLYNSSGFAFGGGARGAFTGSVLEGANDLNQLNKDCSAGTSACTTARINAALDKLGQPRNGALGDLGAAVAYKHGRGVLFAHGLTYVGASPEVDRTNTGACQGAGCIDRNQSKLVLRGISTVEFGVGYGRELGESGLVLGATVKGIAARVGYGEIRVVTEDPGAGGLKDFRDNTKQGLQPGVDAGLLWDIRETFPIIPLRPRIGVVGRNLNAPKFKQPAAAIASGERPHFRLDGQARAGAALSPFDFWHLVADFDLTENVTPIDGYPSRYFSAGTEINVFNSPRFNIPLRAGLQKNVAKRADDSLAFTGGVGLHFLHVLLDVGAQVAAKRTEIQSEGKLEKVPNNAAVAVQLAVLFGGDEGREGR